MSDKTPDTVEARVPMSRRFLNGGFLAVLGIAGGAAGYYLGIPAGFMIGSMLLILIVKLLGAPVRKAPPVFGETGNILLGTFAGALFDRDTLSNLGSFLIPALAVMVGLIVLGLLVAWVLAGVGKMDASTCLFGLTPGGLAEMIAASKSTGADTGMVITLQLLRFYMLLIVAILFVRWLAA